VDLAGQQFSRLFVIERSMTSKWLCRCDCGGLRTYTASQLRRQVVRSCGCLRREKTIERSTKHGNARRGRLTTEYNIWSEMHRRCKNQSDKSYARYGGRGIRVCAAWSSFEQFFADMGNRPAGWTLDRIDNKQGYSAENCRWAEWKTQQRNRTNNRIIEWRGRSQALAAWAEELGIKSSTLGKRLREGWAVERAFTTSVPRRRAA